MRYYQLIFDHMPYISFAHKHETTSYSNKFPIKPNFFEVTLFDVGEMIATTQAGQILLSAPCIYTGICNEPVSIVSSSPLHRHFTVGINCSVSKKEITEAEMMKYWKAKLSGQTPSEHIAILPEVITDSMIVGVLDPLIKKIILEKSKNTPDSSLLCISVLFQIFAITTEFSMKQAALHNRTESFPTGTMYCSRVVNYVSKHIHEKIYVTEIAASLKISTGHLSRIFKETTGYSIIEYCNLLKINYVKNLLAVENISSSEAAAQIGIDDEKYFCRLFKKHTGMTITEYKNTLKQSH